MSVELVVLSPSGKPLGPLECLDVCAESCRLAWKAPLDDGGCPILDYKIEMLCPKTKKWKKIGNKKPELPLEFPVKDLEEGQACIKARASQLEKMTADNHLHSVLSIMGYFSILLGKRRTQASHFDLSNSI